jgi:hypothetical protein
MSIFPSLEPIAIKIINTYILSYFIQTPLEFLSPLSFEGRRGLEYTCHPLLSLKYVHFKKRLGDIAIYLKFTFITTICY